MRSSQHSSRRGGIRPGSRTAHLERTAQNIKHRDEESLAGFKRRNARITAEALGIFAPAETLTEVADRRTSFSLPGVRAGDGRIAGDGIEALHRLPLGHTPRRRAA